MTHTAVNLKAYVAIVILAIGGVITMFMCKRGTEEKQELQYRTAQGVVWTTDYNITYEATADLTDSIHRTLDIIDKCASVYNKQSLVTQVNDGTTTQVTPLFALLYNTSLDINAKSDGAFDPTVMPLVNAWGFGYKNGTPPTKQQIDSILTFVGIEKTSLQGLNITKNDPRTQFDFSSIAKGLAVDEIGRMLERNGAKNYLVEIGGEVLAKGINQKGQPWRVAVDMPQDEEQGSVKHDAIKTMTITNLAVATSGNYRKYKEIDGKRVSHIVNPKTGESATSSLLSVTVTAPDCMTADAWATACMVMGEEKVKALFENHLQIGIMTISADPNGNYIIWGNKKFTETLQ